MTIVSGQGTNSVQIQLAGTGTGTGTITLQMISTGGCGTPANTSSQTLVKRPFTFKLYNKKGAVLKQGTSAAGDDFTVNTSDVPADTYFLHVFINKKETIRQVIINHTQH